MSPPSPVRCTNCDREIVQRPDGIWVHKGRRVPLRLCGFINNLMATPPAETDETKDGQA